MIQRPRGTRDFGPDEMETRRYFEGIMRKQAHVFGFREIATPIFEYTELFTLKSGPNVVEETYSFSDKGGRDISLRPELTAPVMRFFVNELTNHPRPLKVFYFGPCFRYERPQSGRFREFYQFGAELIGTASPESDAEIIALAAKIVEAVGLTEFRIRVGHIGVLRQKLVDAGIRTEEAPLILQKLDKKEHSEARSRMEQAGMNEEAIQDVITITETVGPAEVLDSLQGEAKDYLREVFSIFQVYGIGSVEVDLGVVRGLDYYTGIVFEIDAPMLGAEKQICGGGSYSLSELFGGEKVFSTGFAIGFDRTLLALEKEGFKAPERKVDSYIIPVTDQMRLDAFRLAATLRGQGIITEVDLMRRSLSKNFKYADSIHASYVILVGEKEMSQGSISLRDMRTGDQTLVRIEDLVAFFQK